MKLDRNSGRGKYAVVRLRNVTALDVDAQTALRQLEVGGFVEYAKPGDTDEFFVVKLKDKYAAAALTAYAQAALVDDPEYAADILELAQRAAAHPQRKKPD